MKIVTLKFDLKKSQNPEQRAQSSRRPVTELERQALELGEDSRAWKVLEIRELIAVDLYEDDRKLDIATDKLLDDLMK